MDGCRTGDSAAIELAAHSLRSSAANIGAIRIEGLSAKVERLATACELHSIQPFLDELVIACDRIRPELEAILTGETP